MTNPGPSFPRPSTRPALPQVRPTPAPGRNPAPYGNGSPAYLTPDAAYRAPDTAPAAPRTKRSLAWIYYSIIAVVAVFASIDAGKPEILIAAALCAAYAVYIFRGGRVVFWIW
jgi:hypothetical protein